MDVIFRLSFQLKCWRIYSSKIDWTHLRNCWWCICISEFIFSFPPIAISAVYNTECIFYSWTLRTHTSSGRAKNSELTYTQISSFKSNTQKMNSGQAQKNTFIYQIYWYSNEIGIWCVSFIIYLISTVFFSFAKFYISHSTWDLKFFSPYVFVLLCLFFHKCLMRLNKWNEKRFV